MNAELNEKAWAITCTQPVSDYGRSQTNARSLGHKKSNTNLLCSEYGTGITKVDRLGYGEKQHQKVSLDLKQ